MVRACGTYGKRTDAYRGLVRKPQWMRTLVRLMMILRCILRKSVETARSGLIWRRKGRGSDLLWAWYEPFGLCKKGGISWLADELSFPRTLMHRVTTSTRHITCTKLSATSFVIYDVYITRLVLKRYFSNWSTTSSTVCHFQITLIGSYTLLTQYEPFRPWSNSPVRPYTSHNK